MPKCPLCGAEVSEEAGDLIKKWDATPKRDKGKIKVMIYYWQCPDSDCKHKFRTAERTWPKPEKD